MSTNTVRYLATALAAATALLTVRATDYYVGGENASDDNDGITAPFATIDKAVITATSSEDVIYVAPGEYETSLPEYVAKTDNAKWGPNLKAKLVGTGTDRANVILKSHGEYRTLRMASGSWLENVTVVGEGTYKADKGGAIEMSGGVLKNCILRGGTSTQRGGNLFISAGAVYDCIITGGSCDPASDQYHGGGNVFMTKGLISRCKITGGVINSGNDRAGGIHVGGEDADEKIIEDCLISGNKQGGIRYCKNVDIYNCSIIDNVGYGVYAYAGRNRPFVNNVLFGNVDSSGNKKEWSGNKSSGTQYIATDDTNFSSYTGYLAIDSSVFADYNGNNYKPIEGGKICNAGVVDPRDVNASSRDLLGKDRVFGSAVDIGCYEFQPICVNDGNVSSEFPYNTQGKAFATMQGALAVAEDGDSVWVYPGAYTTTSQMTISKVVRVKGVGDSPEAVVVRNTGTAGIGNQYCRVFELNNPTSRIENLAIEGGQVYNQNGGNLRIASGVVSNCVIRGGLVFPDRNPNVDNSLASGAGVEVSGKGVLTHCVVTNNVVNGTAKEKSYAYAGGAVFVPYGAAPKISNCLVAFNTYTTSVSSVAGSAGIRCGGSNETAVFENVTVVSNVVNGTISDNSAGMYCTSWSTTVRNCVFAGNYVTGTDSLSAAYFQHEGHMTVRNCAMDVVDSVYSSHIVSGTPDDFFKDFANGDFRPRTGGKLYNKGATPSISTSVDLLGNPRVFGRTIDIGCYESQVPRGVIMIFY